MSMLGTRVQRVEDPRLLTHGGTYTADLTELDDPRLAGAAHVTFVRSMVARGTVSELDTSGAADGEGVLGVFTAADLHAQGLTRPGAPSAGEGPALEGPPPDEGDPSAAPWLASTEVRFVGEALAAVVTEQLDQGEDAAESVFADVESLPAVTTISGALADGEVLFPAKGTNTVLTFDFGGDEIDLDACEVVVRQTVVNQRVAACPLEVRSCAAVWEGDQLTMWTSSQSAHGARSALAAAFELPESHVRVIAPDVGGGFGAKIGLAREEVVVAHLARHLGRPLRWTETRSENMVGMVHGRAQENLVELGGRRDGTIEVYRLTVVQDAGAYAGTGATLPFMTRVMTQGVYDIPNVLCTTTSVVTNTTETGAYRGAGRPEATHAVERAVELFAAEIGMDPVEVRRRNLIAADAFPFTTRTGAIYDNGDYATALDRALEAAGYDELRAEQARRRAEGGPRQLGIGICVYVEITAGPFPGEQEYARIEITPDDGAVVYTGSSSHGQGHDTSWAMIVNDRLGIPIERVRVVHGDTELVPEGVGTWGSRSLQVGGTALVNAAEALVERARAMAADLLEAAPGDVVLDTEAGVFHVAGTPSISRSWSEVAAMTIQPETGRHDPLVESTTYAATTPTYPFGAHVAVVEVDTETGRTELVRMVTCDDCGRVLNPLVVEGQRHGGIAQGVAQALLEEISYDEDGNPKTGNLADYGMISAAELPAYELAFMETPTPANPLGAKGIGESGAIGATPAVQNAVIDAVSHLGVRHIDIPTTPEKVWRAIQDATGTA